MENVCNESNKLRRTKRQVWTIGGVTTGASVGFLIGGPIGAGIGAGVGFIAGLSCDLFCPKEPRQNKPPSIQWNKPTITEYFAEPGEISAVVAWNSPTASDEEDDIRTCKETLKYPEKGYLWCENHERIAGTSCHYYCFEGYKLNGNKTRECQTDETFSNSAPTCENSDPPLIIDCPGTQYAYADRGKTTAVISWKIPTVEDNSGESIIPFQTKGQPMGSDFNIGLTEIRYTATDSSGNRSPDCIFFVNVEKNNCPDLFPPQNGALTCDTWMFGRQCMMHCNANYDIPAGAGGASVGRFTGQFTCSTSSGKWSPIETVPGCTVLRNPYFSNLPGEMYYFTGDCNDTETQQKIKENFITEMQALQSDPGWMGICPNPQDCNVENVKLECGGTSRRRRDLHKHRQARQTESDEILVTFHISVKWEAYGNSSMDTFSHLQTKAKSLGSLIEQKALSGSLDVGDAVFDSTSFLMGMPFIKCEPGRYPRYSTLTCASCPLGSTFDKDKSKCTECPKGSYRDNDNDVTCTTCPPGTSTSSNGTINSTECVSICKRGHYSLTGVIPCTPCSRFHYGPDEMATQCIPCGPGLMTSLSASTDISECTDIHVSDFLLTNAVLTDDDMQTLASTCYNNRNGSVTMEDVRRIDANGVELISPSICDADDNCNPDPCNGHNCTDGLGGFICRCKEEFTGERCQNPPDYCKHHQCINGATCNNMQTNYTCSCTPGFKGSFCGYKIVDGGWASWSNWSSCSKSCGGGDRIRRRQCNNPNPDPDGKQCIGQMTETELCNEEECPVCPRVPRAFGTVMECNKTVDMTFCTARCRDGLWFVPGFPPLPEYKCGSETFYKWNGKPPSCSSVYSPAKIEMVSTVEYQSTNLCNNKNDMETAILQKFQSHIQCALANTCHVEVSVEGCRGRSKRSIDESVKAVITMQIPLTGNEGQRIGTLSQTEISPLFLTILYAVGDLENSTRQLNTSRNILKIEVDGQVYDVIGVKSRSNIDCSDGKIQLEAFCSKLKLE
ncbi:Sushi, von Willebrand factor type A, EGF and pentraxin domain-containing protein 1 [Mizuhopecten yessoensis]|uniref:Sushi, von Willebrand factor type A, EGF and pentraxin domain-containing protein 1 n=1 Tax=Mizuhopecten yessoensis TaxID=6573 RepID=A0A210QHA5_MIZYE|nr:Sushi, von Willebrand factor type A, EGF and pentraxin domain-containing protein 1 [Mizuhopecten yessoensis]